MKLILCVFFGLMAGAGSVYGQSPVSRDTLQLPKPAFGWAQEPPIVNLTFKTYPQVQIMQPDHMSCVMPDLALSGRMPVQRMTSADPMPNGIRVHP